MQYTRKSLFDFVLELCRYHILEGGGWSDVCSGIRGDGRVGGRLGDRGWR